MKALTLLGRSLVDLFRKCGGNSLQQFHELAPRDAQTGPAVRYDENVMSNHLAMLVDSPALQEIYKLMSKSIHEHHQL